MDNFGLYLVITNPLTGYARCAEAAVKAGVAFIQLRMKNAPVDEIIEQGNLLRKITEGSETKLIINDDPAIAERVNADGVHLGQSDLSITEARRLYPSLTIFGLSTHSFEQMTAAKKVKPDYIGVGPVYATPTKAIPDPVLGPEEAGRIIKNADCPAVAIGGIDECRLPDVLRFGAKNFSVVRAVCNSEKPYEAILNLQRIYSEIKNGILS